MTNLHNSQISNHQTMDHPFQRKNPNPPPRASAHRKLARPAGEDGGSANAAPPTSDQVKESFESLLESV